LRRFIQASFLLYAAGCAERNNLTLGIEPGFEEDNILSVVAPNVSAEATIRLCALVVHLMREHGSIRAGLASSIWLTLAEVVGTDDVNAISAP
jgi:hypothetical protein